MKRVLIITNRIAQYRAAFFDGLRDRLAENEIKLTVIHGEASPRIATKRDSVDLPWTTKVRNRYWTVGSREVVWQPVLSHARHADLVIVNQAVQYLGNYPLLALRALGFLRLAFWDHPPKVRSQTAIQSSEWLKRRTVRWADWWFVYTEGSAKIVQSMGFPRSRITIVRNAIDTRSLSAERDRQGPEETASLRQALDLGSGPVCLFCGGMYPAKRLDFLLSACEYVHSVLPGFRMLFLGDGPDRSRVITAADLHPWIRWVGPVFDTERVRYFAVSDLLLIPAAVGLVVLDSFAMGVPLVTTNDRSHGPEIEYLQDGINGVIVKNSQDPTVYGKTVVRLLRESSHRSSLAHGAKAAANQYSIEDMVDRFVSGVIAALDSRCSA